MSGVAVRVARYRVRLARPLRFAGRELAFREGFFVAIEETSTRSRGIGEVAPMPGVHRESVDECLEILSRLDPELVRPLARARDQDGALDALPSCLAFGVSCARRIAEGDAVLMRPLRARCGVNALFAGDAEDARRALAEGAFAGFRTVKVKVGRPDGAAERRMLDALLAGLGPAVRLRLDANRALELADAVDRFRGLDATRIEYVEEPVADPFEMPAFHFATGLAIALDESMLEPEVLAAIETVPGVVAHLLKPSLVGRIARVRERAARTARQGLRTTLSSALESSYTLRVLARLATWLPGAEGDHGLGSGGMLLDEPVPPLGVRDGAVDPSAPLEVPTLAFVPIAEARGG